MDNNENSTMKKDIEFLEKAFKKWTPKMLASPYIPTPTILLQSQVSEELNNFKEVKIEKTPATKPSKVNKKDYDLIISYLHKGAVAYSMGDYGTAINNFTRLLETEWLKYSSYFYLVKTLIKLDIEKEILSLKKGGQVNNIKMKKDKN